MRPEADYVTIEDVVRILEISRPTVRKMMADGRLKAVNINKAGIRPFWRITKESLNKLRSGK
jgi:excisionase family DNA binding protein